MTQRKILMDYSLQEGETKQKIYTFCLGGVWIFVCLFAFLCVCGVVVRVCVDESAKKTVMHYKIFDLSGCPLNFIGIEKTENCR